MVYFWLAVVILLVIIEILTFNMVTIWFIASALFALGISFFIDEFIWQFGVFVILGTIFLITTRPLLLKKLAHKKVNTNLDRIVGMRGKVTKKIEIDDLGEVKVDGKIWFAYADELIEVEKIVIIEAIEGTKLKVKEVR